MSRNAYALFEMIIPNGGVYASAAENGGDSCVAEGRAKKGTPPSACFWHLPLFIVGQPD